MNIFYVPYRFAAKNENNFGLAMFTTNNDINYKRFCGVLTEIAANNMANEDDYRDDNVLLDDIFCELAEVTGCVWDYCEPSMTDTLVISNTKVKKGRVRVVNAREFAELLIALNLNERIAFYETFDEKTGELSGRHWAASIHEFDADMLLLNCEGGGRPYAIDITEYDAELKQLIFEVNEYFDRITNGVSIVYIEE